MHDLSIKDPCLIFALSREAHYFCQEFKPYRRCASAPCWMYFCGPSWLSVVVAHSGVGKKNAWALMDWLEDVPQFEHLRYRPKVVIAAGYAGGLVEDLSAGDVVLATEIVDQSGASFPTTWPPQPLQGQWQPALHPGRIVTVDKLTATSAEKRALSQKHRAVAVDMESAAIAQRCRSAGIPFGCVRVISDDVGTELSAKLASLISGGKASWWRVLFLVLRSPKCALELMRLARDTRTASEQLAKALGELLTLTLNWSDEIEVERREDD